MRKEFIAILFFTIGFIYGITVIMVMATAG